VHQPKTGDDEVFEFQIILMEQKRPNDAGATNEEKWGGWSVARTDTNAPKRGKVETKQPVSDAAAKIAQQKVKKGTTLDN
jgi:hypothetical protein